MVWKFPEVLRALDEEKHVFFFARPSQRGIIRPELVAKDPNGAGHRANLE
jgi:hypothetical protein